MEVNKVGAGRGNESGEQAQQLQRRQHQVGGAVRRWALEAVGEAPILPPGETLQGQGPASAVAAEPLETGAVMCMDAGIRVERKALEKGAAGLLARWARRVREGQAALEGEAVALRVPAGVLALLVLLDRRARRG